jgi:hypothetical protein
LKKSTLNLSGIFGPAHHKGWALKDSRTEVGQKHRKNL